MRGWLQGSSGRLLLCSLVVCAAAGLGWAVLGQAQEKKAAAPAGPIKPALVVNTVRASTAELPLRLTANGSVAAWQEASVGAEISGLRLADLRAAVGDQVKRGQVLAVLASESIEADLAVAQASVAESQAALAEARANAERARQVQGTGAISAQQISQYFTAEQTAQARLNLVNAQLRTQQLRLRQTRVLAPDDGVIVSRSATLGVVVGAGQELFRMVRKNRLEWRAEVTATELSLIKPGQVVNVLPVNGNAVRGTVRMLAPSVDPQTRNAIIYVDLPPGGALRAGMFARGEFELGSNQALTVPQQAVVVRDGFNYVFRLGADQRVTQVKVSVGRRSGERIEILEGITADAVLVSSGAGFLNDGDLVKVAAAAK